MVLHGPDRFGQHVCYLLMEALFYAYALSETTAYRACPCVNPYAVVWISASR
jgi:hypothetical protein